MTEYSSRQMLLSLVGILYIILGFYTLYLPETLLTNTNKIAGIFISSCGVFLLIDAIQATQRNNIQNNLLLEGLITVIVSIILFFSQYFSTYLTLYSIIIWLISISILHIFLANKIRGAWSLFIIVVNIIILILSTFTVLEDHYINHGFFIWSLSLSLIFLGIHHLINSSKKQGNLLNN